MKPFFIRSAGSVVEVWTGYRIQFGGMERHSWQKDLKTHLKAALGQQQFAAGVPILGHYWTSDPRVADTENSLFTNVLECMPAGVMSLRFERGSEAPPTPPESVDLVGGHLHYYRYQVNGSWAVWEPDEVVARWQRLPRRLTDDGSARPVWFALREGSADNRIAFTETELGDHTNFGLRLTVHASTFGPRNAITYSERLIDGTIAAFHHDVCTDGVLAALLPKFPKVSDEMLRRALDHPAGPLFDSAAIQVKGGFVQISPADERCIVGELAIRQDSTAKWPELSGELFTIRPASQVGG